MSPDLDDEFRWLEALSSTEVTAWVRARNAETRDALADDPSFGALSAELRQVLDAADRVPFVHWDGTYLYNLWKDEGHPRGLWRRTTIDEYRRAEPNWEVLLDVDALAAAEGEPWTWQGAIAQRPGHRRCLIRLARGGSDASVVREFDLTDRAFVPDGFTLPEAKSDVGWIDADHIYVGTDFGPGSLTASGYPRIVKRWRRGTPLAEATVVHQGRDDDVSVYAVHDPTPGFVRDFLGRRLDFFRREEFLRTVDGELVRIDVPEDAETDVHREWLLIALRSDWAIGDRTYAAGTVLVTRLDRFLAGERDLTVVFAPGPESAPGRHAWTRGHLILSSLVDVRSRTEVLTPGPDGWRRTPLLETVGPEEERHVVIVDTNPEHSDEYLLASTGFLTPTALHHGTVGGPAETLKRDPAFFDPAGMAVRQLHARSADGTRVPYFLVSPPGEPTGPTLLTGYGGFEMAWTPSYSGIIGRGWLARGGSYVVANIRGGGEYGPRWHRAALRENRLRAYEDFAAVATDLVDRGITIPARLGIEGGSNGGLLMGVMLTRFPELFGAVVARVPLFDMRRYHLLLAGASWMAEYGDPDDEADWAFLREYSPYHNVRPGREYPPVLLVTSSRDDRVHPGHARKMAARMRGYGYDVSYYENIEGGHGAAADNAQLAFKWALMLRFLWRRLTDAPH
ncbi:prolyl oligopeptidase family serine peptidase [Plantactinospora mayteni]|uniref:Prolyl oligopeptidase n=1 Tax=Plantactinospora mayteni TaxID=566021 RepID=A0ABQ4F3L8_9ACTN|nr:prolyl oligopeptidase family serine peptidase [Plantactinospora mayteni]GIH01513.1 prolyl oligopeptidase [Plantactinospora mayteni]